MIRSLLSRGRATLQDQRGVTLTELTLVIVILFVLAVGSYAFLGNFLQVGQAKGASEEVASVVRETRHLAITQAQSHRIILTGTTYEIRIEPYGGGDVVRGPVTISHDGNVSSQTLTFSPTGSVDPPGPTTVTVTASACSVNMTVTPAGGITLAGPPC